MVLHPQAAAQPTTTGRIIAELHAYDGRIYAGYGDYGENTGPVVIASLDPDTLEWTVHHTLLSEAIYQYRTLGGKLYVPSVDPRGSFSDDFATDATGTWVSHNKVVSATHAFDMARTPNGDLWIAGSQNEDAVIWRNTGSGWAESRRVTPPAGQFSRFYWLAVAGTDVLAHVTDSISGERPNARRWNGTAWVMASAVNLGGFSSGALPWGEGFLFKSEGGLWKWLANTSTFVRAAIDFKIDGSNVYILRPNGTVEVSTDLTNWAAVTGTLTGAASLAVLDGVAYIGRYNSTVEPVTIVAPGSPDPGTGDPPDPIPPPPQPVSTEPSTSPPRAGRKLLM